MLVSVLSVLFTVFGIGLIIFVHELGHFLAARAVGIRVEAFSIGFGRRLWGFTRGATEYKVCAVPIGGYVKMAGEDPTRPTTGEPDEFGSKKVWQRMLVISAGVIMNALFALLLYAVCFAVGVQFVAPVIGNVSPGSPAWEAGLRRGDRVLAIEGSRVLGFEDIRTDVAVSGGPLAIDLDRDGVRRTVTVVPRADDAQGIRTIGVEMTYRPAVLDKSVFEPPEGDAAALAMARNLKAAGLAPGDEIVAVNGVPLALWTPEAEQGEPLTLEVARDGRRLEVVLPPVMKTLDGPEDWIIGVVGHSLQVRKVRAGSPGAAMGLRPGDRILTVNGRDAVLAGGLARALNEGRKLPLGAPGEDRPYDAPTVTLTVAREGAEPVTLAAALPRPSERAALVEGLFLEPDLRVEVLPDRPAAKAGLVTGDRLVAIDGQEISSYEALIGKVRASGGRALTVAVERAGGRHELAVVPERPQRIVPLAVEVVAMETFRVPLSESVGVGVTYTLRKVKQIYLTLRSFFSGSVSTRHLTGPIGIVQMSYKVSALFGLMTGLLFLAFISINLAIVNFLPIPILDGGWFVFLLIEKIKGSPISEKAMGYFQWAGLAFIIGLFVLATWNDIVRILSL